MTIRTIEVPCYTGLDLAHLLDAALALAKPFGAHIDTTCVLPDPIAEMAMLPPLSGGAGMLELPEFEKLIEANRTRLKAAFDEWCATNAVPTAPEGHRLDSVFARWREAEGPIEAVVMRHGRLADVTVLRRPGPGDTAGARCFDAAVFATGRPALIVADALPARLLRHALVAWNGSLEATHAVAQSISILHEAEQVSIFSAPRHGDETAPELDLAAALRWHGIEAGCVRHPGGSQPVGEALLEAADRVDATLLVMGGYTHSRVREVLLGGVTRHVLQKCPIPVIMAH